LPVSAALASLLFLGGGLALFFLSASRLFERINPHIPQAAGVVLGIAFIVGGLFLCGALWGSSLARLLGEPPKPAARAGGLAFAGFTLLAGVLLELVFVALGGFLFDGPIPVHVAFSILFVPSAGLIAGLCARAVSGALGRGEGNARLAQAVGLAGAAGFLAVNLVMLALGWQVGAPGAAERMTMITVLLTSNAGAALAGGWALGRGLAGHPSL
jgi:hypothetical protein